MFKCRQTPEQKFRWDFEVAAEHQWRGDDSVGSKLVLQWK